MDVQNHDFLVPESKVIRMPSLKRGKDDVPLDDRVSENASFFFFFFLKRNNHDGKKKKNILKTRILMNFFYI